MGRNSFHTVTHSVQGLMSRKTVRVVPNPRLRLEDMATAVEFEVKEDTTTEWILQKVLRFFDLPFLESASYGLFPSSDCHESLLPACTPYSIPQDILYLSRATINITVFIEQSEKQQLYTVPPWTVVQDLIRFITSVRYESASYDGSPRSGVVMHDLILLSGENADTEGRAKGTRMLLKSALEDYFVTPTDTLFLTSTIKMENERWSSTTNNDKQETMVFVECEDHGMTKTFRLNANTTFGEILTLFFEKTKIQAHPYFYGLHLNLPELPSELLKPEDKLSYFPFAKTLPLVCKAKKRAPQEHFGVDPFKLPLVQHMDLWVPEILYVLHDLFVSRNGHQFPGIFRISGNQMEMQDCVERFNAGLPIFTLDVCAIGTLIKRWFKSLPQPLYHSLDKEYLKSASPSARIQAYQQLPWGERTLVTWMIELLLETAKYSNINQMTPSNLGIVFGPSLFSSLSTQMPAQGQSALALMQEVEDCKLGKELIEEMVTYFLLHPEERPLMNKPRHPRSDRVSDTTVTVPRTSSLVKLLAERSPSFDVEGTGEDVPTREVLLRKDPRRKSSRDLIRRLSQKSKDSSSSKDASKEVKSHGVVQHESPSSGKDRRRSRSRRTKSRETLSRTLRRSDSDLTALLAQGTQTTRVSKITKSRPTLGQLFVEM